MTAISKKREHYDSASFDKAMADLILVHRDMATEQLQVGKIFLGIAATAGRHGLALPSEVALLGMALANLDQIVHVLDPKFDRRESLDGVPHK